MNRDERVPYLDVSESVSDTSIGTAPEKKKGKTMAALKTTLKEKLQKKNSKIEAEQEISKTSVQSRATAKESIRPRAKNGKSPTNAQSKAEAKGSTTNVPSRGKEGNSTPTYSPKVTKGKAGRDVKALEDMDERVQNTPKQRNARVSNTTETARNKDSKLKLTPSHFNAQEKHNKTRRKYKFANIYVDLD